MGIDGSVCADCHPQSKRQEFFSRTFTTKQKVYRGKVVQVQHVIPRHKTLCKIEKSTRAPPRTHNRDALSPCRQNIDARVRPGFGVHLPLHVSRDSHQSTFRNSWHRTHTHILIAAASVCAHGSSEYVRGHIQVVNHLRVVEACLQHACRG